MLICIRIRLRTLTDPDPAYVALRSKSAQHKPGYPSNLPEHPAGATLYGSTPATPVFSCARPDVSATPEQHSIPIHPPR
jgi:hypothetical protein